MKKIKVILADDHAILRYGLRMFLSSAEDITIVGEASSGEECIKLCKKLKPDVCVLDIGMPDMDGIQAAKAIGELEADIKILILSMYLSQQKLKDVLRVGIDGYLLKSAPKKNILEGIRSVAAGDQVYSDSISKLITRSLIDESSKRRTRHIHGITDRELEVLNLVVAGYPSAKIAKKLYISTRTVETHRNNIMKKLDIHNTASLVRFALQNNLVEKQPSE